MLQEYPTPQKTLKTTSCAKKRGVFYQPVSYYYYYYYYDDDDDDYDDYDYYYETEV